jgi:hypothetical protein
MSKEDSTPQFDHLTPISIGDYFKLPNPGLRSYFERVRAGNPDDYRTPFFKGRTRSEAISEWCKILEQHDLKVQFPDLYAYEMEQKEKIGPLSIMKSLRERLADVEDYFTGVADPGEPILDSAMVNAMNKIHPSSSKLRMRSFENTVKSMRMNTNSGSPYFVRRSRVVLDSINEAYAVLRSHSVYKLAAVLGWRGQEHGPEASDVKQRVVWMMPFSLNIAELSVYQPLILAAQAKETVPAWCGNEYVDREVTAMFDTKSKDDLVICTDFTKFDQHFGEPLQNCAQNMLLHMFTPGKAFDEWLLSVYHQKYNLPIIISMDSGFSGHHGMGSGSGGTNADETLAHTALQFESAEKNGTKLNLHSQCLGDDGCLTFPGITVDKVMQTYTPHGLIMNPEKQYVSTHDCIFLRRWHDVNYRVGGVMVGVYPTMRALSRMLGQERYYDPEVWGAEMVEMRYLSILQNCCYHPLFHEFVDWVMTHDKYRLGLDLPGFFELSRVASRFEKLQEYNYSFGQYSQQIATDVHPTSAWVQAKGFLSWDVVKYVLSKR